jgi:predicted CopG family antitoxin
MKRVKIFLNIGLEEDVVKKLKQKQKEDGMINMTEVIRVLLEGKKKNGK